MTEHQIIADDIRAQLAELNALLSRAADLGVTVQIGRTDVQHIGEACSRLHLTAEISRIEAL